MESIICKHFYSDIKNNHITINSYTIFDDFKQLVEIIPAIYQRYCKNYDIPYDESNIQIYRCGSISNLGEFRIYSTPLPIYLKDIKEALKND